MKRIILILLSLSIAVSVMACSNKDSNNSNGQSVSNTSGQSENNKDSGQSEKSKEASEDDAILKGNVTEATKTKVTIQKVVESDNGNIQDAQPGDKDSKATFNISNNTKVVIREIKGKGDNYNDSNGSIDDIKNNCLIDVWGNKDGDTVTATKVVIYKFK